MKTKFLFDMDGVLAKWKQVSVEKTFEDGYFLSVELEEKVRELMFDLLDKGYEVNLLTAAYTEGTAKADKRTWIAIHGLTHIPCIFVPYGRDKSDFVEKDVTNILIDDFTENLLSWEKAGNIGVKFYNGINGTKGRWTGYSIDHRMSVKQMSVILRGIAAAAEGGAA